MEHGERWRPRWALALPVFVVLWASDVVFDSAAATAGSTLLLAIVPAALTWAGWRAFQDETQRGLTAAIAAAGSTCNVAYLGLSVHYGFVDVEAGNLGLVELLWTGRILAVVWALFYVRGGRA